MDKRKPKTKFRQKRTGNTILDREDYTMLDGKLILNDSYYTKRGIKNPNKNGD